MEKQRKKQKRREWRIKRAIVSLIGWSVIAGMIYLIIVTAQNVPKIWDPYDVLGVSRVRNLYTSVSRVLANNR